jgi:hypothetical protein
LSGTVTAETFQEIIMQFISLLNEERFLMVTAGWRYLAHCKLNNGNAYAVL